MKNSIGNSLILTIFGESHGAAVGAVLDGMAPGVEVDEDFIKLQMGLRKASGEISTSRIEGDEVEILSGVFNGKTTGAPIAFLIRNNNTKSSDYEKTRALMRPGHADYTANCKYHGFEDYRGGGHFSGRITAGIVAAGSIVIEALRKKGIYIATHIKNLNSVYDDEIENYNDFARELCDKPFPVINDNAEIKMKEAILKAKAEGDSLGGILETVVIGVPKGVGEPWFSSVEGELASFLFSIPAIKGVEFGSGFAFSDMKGSEANDSFCFVDGNVETKSNNNGGVNGGITNGMPIVFSSVVKPTPSIAKEQRTINIDSKENADLVISGRHDPAIIHRARVVVNAATALVIADLLALRYGTDWLGE